MNTKLISKEEIQELAYIKKGAYHWNLDKNKRSDYLLLCKYNHLFNKIKEINPSKIVDIGCGDGYFTNLLAREFSNTIGVDYSPLAIKLAKSKASNLNLIVADAKNLPIKSESVDLVSCIETIEHNSLQDIPKIISEAHRILKENGHMILSVPSKNMPLSEKHYTHFDRDLLVSFLIDFRKIDFEGLIKANPGVLSYVSKLASNKTYSLPIIGNFFATKFYEKLFFSCNYKNASTLVATCMK